MAHTDGVDVGHEGGFVQIGMRHNHLADALIACMQQNRQQSVDGKHRAVEIHFPEHDGVVQAIVGYRSGCAEHARCDRQIMRGTAFGHGCRRKIDRDPCLRPFCAAGLACGFDTFPRFGKRGVGKSNDGEVRKSGGDERLDLDDEGFQSDQSHGKCAADGHQNAPSIWCTSGLPSRTMTVMTSNRTPLCGVRWSLSDSHCTAAWRRLICLDDVTASCGVP